MSVVRGQEIWREHVTGDMEAYKERGLGSREMCDIRAEREHWEKKDTGKQQEQGGGEKWKQNVSVFVKAIKGICYFVSTKEKA